MPPAGFNMLSVIVPVYNGEQHLQELVRRLSAAADSAGECIEIVFVDDGSTDGSLRIMTELACGRSFIRCISFRRNFGQQAAVLCGLRECRGDWIATIDDDLAHPPELIFKMKAEAERAHADAVYAVNDDYRLKTSSVRDLFFVLFLGKPRRLRLGSFRLFSGRAAEEIGSARGAFVYVSAEFFKTGYKAVNLAFAGETAADRVSRYNFFSRALLFIKIILRYTPGLGFLFRIITVNRRQYRIAEEIRPVC